VKTYAALTSKSLPALTVWIRLGLAVVTAIGLCHCSTTKSGKPSTVSTDVVVSVKEQKLALYNKKGTVAAKYPISTSKFGLNDKPGRYGTPLGLHEVVAKIGHGARPGTVFKSRQPTGEIIKPNAPGRDPIVSRIMWLRGMEKQNQNAYGRCIYIHGTAAENQIGQPVSYGCIRMKSADVIDLFQKMGIGSRVLIVEGGLPKSVPAAPLAPIKQVPADAPPIFLNPQQQGPIAVPPPAHQPGVMPAAPQQSYQPVILAKNNNGPVPARELGTAAVSSIPNEAAPPPSEAANMPAYRSSQHANGSTVIYSAPGTSSTSSIVLKSKSKRAVAQNKQQ